MITIDIFHLLLKPLLRIFVLKCDCPARLCGNTCGHPDLDCHNGSGNNDPGDLDDRDHDEHITTQQGPGIRAPLQATG